MDLKEYNTFWYGVIAATLITWGLLPDYSTPDEYGFGQIVCLGNGGLEKWNNYASIMYDFKCKNGVEYNNVTYNDILLKMNPWPGG